MVLGKQLNSQRTLWKTHSGQTLYWLETHESRWSCWSWQHLWRNGWRRPVRGRGKICRAGERMPQNGVPGAGFNHWTTSVGKPRQGALQEDPFAKLVVSVKRRASGQVWEAAETAVDQEEQWLTLFGLRQGLIAWARMCEVERPGTPDDPKYYHWWCAQ